MWASVCAYGVGRSHEHLSLSYPPPIAHVMCVLHRKQSSLSVPLASGERRDGDEERKN